MSTDPAPGPRDRSPRRLVALAAVVALGVGVAVLLRQRPPAPTDASLRRAAERLARDAPGLFAGFRPLSPRERAERSADAPRPGLAIHRPRGTIVDASPDFAWEPVSGATRYHVRVHDPQGRLVFERESRDARLAYPMDLVGPLEPGSRFVVSVEASGPAGEARGSEAFRTLEADAARRYERGLLVIRERLTAGERDVLGAHWALRFGLLHAAARLLGAQREVAGPGRETWDWLRDRLGR